MPRTLEERFWEKVSRDGGCWVWTAAKTSAGYGAIKVEGKVVLAHRVSFELTNGPIEDGLTLDHLCKNTLCVRPTHLEAVTHAENVRRGEAGKVNNRQAEKTHCRQGHPFDEANTYKRGDRPSQRGCRACRRAAQARHETRRRESG